jgi:hypothetical protein
MCASGDVAHANARGHNQAAGAYHGAHHVAYHRRHGHDVLLQQLKAQREHLIHQHRRQAARQGGSILKQHRHDQRVAMEKVDPLQALLFLGVAATRHDQRLLLFRVRHRQAGGLRVGRQLDGVELQQLADLALRVEQRTPQELGRNGWYAYGDVPQQLRRRGPNSEVGMPENS